MQIEDKKFIKFKYPLMMMMSHGYSLFCIGGTPIKRKRREKDGAQSSAGSRAYVSRLTHNGGTILTTCCENQPVH